MGEQREEVGVLRILKHGAGSGGAGTLSHLKGEYSRMGLQRDHLCTFKGADPGRAFADGMKNHCWAELYE